jgi:hypothetical protein
MSFSITYIWNKKQFTSSEQSGNSVEDAIERFKLGFYACNQVHINVISAKEITNTNTIKIQLTEEEMFNNGLYNFNSIESLNNYINEKVLKVYPYLKGYTSIMMNIVEKDQKQGKDLTSILIYAENRIASLVNRPYLY